MVYFADNTVLKPTLFNNYVTRHLRRRKDEFFAEDYIRTYIYGRIKIVVVSVKHYRTKTSEKILWEFNFPENCCKA